MKQLCQSDTRFVLALNAKNTLEICLAATEDSQVVVSSQATNVVAAAVSAVSAVPTVPAVPKVLPVAQPVAKFAAGTRECGDESMVAKAVKVDEVRDVQMDP